MQEGEENNRFMEYWKVATKTTLEKKNINIKIILNIKPALLQIVFKLTRHVISHLTLMYNKSMVFEVYIRWSFTEITNAECYSHWNLFFQVSLVSQWKIWVMFFEVKFRDRFPRIFRWVAWSLWFCLIFYDKTLI